MSGTHRRTPEYSVFPTGSGGVPFAPSGSPAFLRVLLIICSFLFISPHLRAQTQMTPDSLSEAAIHRGIGYVYNLSFDSARTEFQWVAKHAPDHPSGHFFLAMVEWWRIITNFSDKSHDDRFIAMLDRVIDLCDKRLDADGNDLAGLFFKGGALGFEGRLYGNREEWLKAANAGRQALPLIRQAYKAAPGNSDILFGIGLYNYYAEVVPEQYPWVKPFMVFFPSGDRQKGIRQLRTAADQARYAGVEATYFLLQVLNSYEKRYDESITLATRLHTRFPNNVLFHRYLGRTYSALGRWDDMRSTYQEILDRVGQHRTGYDIVADREARYYLGFYDMQMGKNESALQWFYKADELSRSIDASEFSGFMAMANLRIGMIYDMQGKRDLAVGQYRKVLDMKNYQDAHAQAERFLKKPYGTP